MIGNVDIGIDYVFQYLRNFLEIYILARCFLQDLINAAGFLQQGDVSKILPPAFSLKLLKNNEL